MEFKKVKNRFTAFLLSLVMCLSVMVAPAHADSAVRSGKQGAKTSHVTWVEQLRGRFILLYKDFSEGYSWLTIVEGAGNQNFYLVNSQGEILQKLTGADDVLPFQEGLSAFGKPLTETQTIWWYVNEHMEQVLGPYESAAPFSEGLACVSKNGKFGYVDQSKDVIIPYEYDRGYAFSNGVACVSKDGKFGCIDSTGKVIIPLEYDSYLGLSEGYCWGRKGDVWSIVDLQGNAIPVPGVTAAFQFDGGLSIVEMDGKRGVVDTSGKIVIPCEYDSIKGFSEDVYTVQKDNAYYIIDKTGKTVASLDYDSVGYFSEGFAEVRKDGKLGHIDTAGNLVIGLDYDAIYGINSGFDSGVAVVAKGDMFGLIDTTGQVVAPFEYTNIYNVGELRWVTKADGSTGILSLVDGDSQPEQTSSTGTAFATSSPVLVNGQRVDFQTYGLKDDSGNLTNYVKLRDIASVVNGTAAQFSVNYDGAISLQTGEAYTPNGSEMQTPFSGDRAFTDSAAPVKVNGSVADLSAILLTDDSGGGFTYFKLRDLGKALGFNVSWDGEAGSIVINTNEPYDDN